MIQRIGSPGISTVVEMLAGGYIFFVFVFETELHYELPGWLRAFCVDQFGL